MIELATLRCVGCGEEWACNAPNGVSILERSRSMRDQHQERCRDFQRLLEHGLSVRRRNVHDIGTGAPPYGPSKAPPAAEQITRCPRPLEVAPVAIDFSGPKGWVTVTVDGVTVTQADGSSICYDGTAESGERMHEAILHHLRVKSERISELCDSVERLGAGWRPPW